MPELCRFYGIVIQMYYPKNGTLSRGRFAGRGASKVPASHSDAFYPYAALRERACSVSSPEAPTNVWPKSLVLVGGGFV